jgi:hypothetical protein
MNVRSAESVMEVSEIGVYANVLSHFFDDLIVSRSVSGTQTFRRCVAVIISSYHVFGMLLSDLIEFVIQVNRL